MSNDYNPNHIETKTFARIGVKAIVLNIEGKFLLLKRSDKMKRQGGKWSLPGGSVERLENPKDAVTREVQEETQLVITNIRPFETTGHEYEEDFVVIIGYICHTENTAVTLNWEHDEYKWVTKEEALGMDLSALVRFFIEKVIISEYES